MSEAKRLKNRPPRDCFLDVYYRVIIIGFLITFGMVIVIMLVQLGRRGAIKVSFAQTGGVLESSASVPFNPTNLLNEKLRQKETELQRAELYLAEVITANEAKILAYLLSISGVLFFLILLNFFLDYKQSLKLRQDSQMKL